MFRLARFTPNLRTASAPAPRAFSSSAPRDYAKITLVGRLAQAPELKTSQNGREYVRFVLATSHGQNRDASFFRVTNFPHAEKSRDHLLGLQKGSMLLVEGDASLSSTEDADGRKHSNLNIVQRSYTVLSRFRREGSEQEGQQGSENGEPLQ